MARDNLSQTVVVFDLDDTLYPEADYLHSGIRYVGHQLEAMRGIVLQPQISEALQGTEKNWLAFLCAAAGLPSSAMESLLWMYRLHPPAIRVAPACARMLNELAQRARALLILTDGRTVTQRLKLNALGLSHLPAYISEDYQSEKPDPLRFRAIEQDCRAARYVYVADNPSKDFLACNALGWTSVGVRGTEKNIHAQSSDGLSADALPEHWINSWQELLDLLC